MVEFISGWPDWLEIAVMLGGALLAALAAHAVIFGLAQRATRIHRSVLYAALIEHGRAPGRMLLILWALSIVRPALPLSSAGADLVRHALSLGLIGVAGWLLIALVQAIDDLAVARYDIEVEDNLTARRLRTQFNVLHRVAVIIIAMVAMAAMLMTFPEVRRIGQGLFASAGLAALVAGIAARPTLSNLIAGVQIALTEPIRLDDVVIIEDEWGRIEEINPTYVVVRIWDLRRLVVPLSYFIEQPFENWTRRTADILGTVFLYVDYSVPVEEVRRQLLRTLETSGLWDGKVCTLQVTATTADAVELRALMSAPNASRSWDLRCHVREQLIAFLQERYPESLPRVRAELQGLPAPLPMARTSGD